MSSLSDERPKRTRASKRIQVSVTSAKTTEGKRRKHSELDTENQNHKKHFSLPKEMTFQSSGIIDSPLSDYNENIHKTSRSGSSLTISTSSLSEKRKSLRQQAMQNDNKINGRARGSLSLENKYPHTPTQLINEMTNFTFSNYLTPVSKENSPLPPLSWANNNEVWEEMLKKDREYKRDPFYINKHPKLRPRMRAVLLDWLIEVSEVYRLHRETFHLAVEFVDRYLSNQSNVPKTRLQLVGVTALFVASKIEEIYPPKLNEFAYVTDGACTSEEILEQEVLLLTSLDWKLSPVTPISWVTAYLQIAHNKIKGNRKLKQDESFEYPQFAGHHLCRVAELLDLCSLDMGFLKFAASVVAASALYHTLGKDVTDCTGHTFEEIFPCIEWIHPFACIIQSQPVKSVKKFDKIPQEDAHNIQVHNNAVQLLDFAHSQLSTKVPLANMKRTSPLVECRGILTPPASAEKDYIV